MVIFHGHVSHNQRVTFLWKGTPTPTSWCVSSTDPWTRFLAQWLMSFSFLAGDFSAGHPFGYGSIPMKIPFWVGWTSINPSYFDVNYRGTRFWHTSILDWFGWILLASAGCHRRGWFERGELHQYQLICGWQSIIIQPGWWFIYIYIIY